jgi:hypothetical protein
VYMIGLTWEKGKKLLGHRVCMVEKLPNEAVTKWMLTEMIICPDGEIIENGMLIAETEDGARLWADPKSRRWRAL